MTPNTLAPQTVYIAQVENNQRTIDDLRPIVGKANAQLDQVPPDLNDGDRWLQDEIEIGYTQSPTHLLYVCFESPRFRGLEDFPESLLGVNFGYVARGSLEERTRLDSFGNLEVSPPVTVNGQDYPLGRILYGDTSSSIPANAQRRFQPSLRDFLKAQQVQKPIELFSDWLNVGHIDEFMTFVPAPTAKGFKLVLDSTSAGYQILESLHAQGLGNVLLRAGQRLSGRSAAISINEILQDQAFKQINQDFQAYINQNETILTKELGLDQEDIIYLPMLFEGSNRRNPEVERADSFFPNMVNMIVLGSQLAIPKPFGPIVNGVCQFEQAVRSQLDPLGLTCNFIDDWDTYFKNFGELHCGTNVKRQASSFPWWHMDN
jgi:protein-arginine deiminase